MWNLALRLSIHPHARSHIGVCSFAAIINAEKEGKGPLEDKLTLACFNSGDVPELIGRLSVALSHATHKVISLPMFRKDLGVSFTGSFFYCVQVLLYWVSRFMVGFDLGLPSTSF